MAFSQIDPARLEGDALRRWYLRPSAEIGEERRQVLSRTHDAFFSRRDDVQSPGPDPNFHGRLASTPENAAAQSTTLGDDRWWAGASPGAPNGHYQMVAATPRGFWGYWGFKGCQTCHGYGPATLPPYGGHSPFPSDYSRRSGGSDGSGRWSEGEGSGGKNPKQCAVQYENDSDICRRVPGTEARQRYWKSAAAREAYCIKSKGEVGYPELITK